MGFTSDACWFLLLKSLLIKNNKKRGAALKSKAGGDEKHVSFYLALFSYYTHEAAVLRSLNISKRKPI